MPGTGERFSSFSGSARSSGDWCNSRTSGMNCRAIGSCASARSIKRTMSGVMATAYRAPTFASAAGSASRAKPAARRADMERSVGFRLLMVAFAPSLGSGEQLGQPPAHCRRELIELAAGARRDFLQRGQEGVRRQPRKGERAVPALTRQELAEFGFARLKGGRRRRYGHDRPARSNGFRDHGGGIIGAKDGIGSGKDGGQRAGARGAEVDEPL